jgi:hypothetical protein
MRTRREVHHNCGVPYSSIQQRPFNRAARFSKDKKALSRTGEFATPVARLAKLNTVRGFDPELAPGDPARMLN